MIRKFRHKPSGFSLIEIIAALLLLSLIGGALYSYFSSAYVESPKPLEKLQKSYDLHMVMENIAADYTMNHPEWQKRHPRWQKLTYYAADTLIRADGNKGYIYKCKIAGKSGVPPPGYTEPVEFGSGISPVNEGTVTWEKKPDLSALRDNIAMPSPNNYGTYIVKENDFIVWDTTYTERTAAAGDPRTILKVTLTNDSGEILTSLFTNLN
jgi:prepilin-type N-terminal cleavage/methylation domain-containing protein